MNREEFRARRRKTHTTAPVGRKKETDALAAALTAQIIICAVLLAAMFIAKNANAEKFGDLRQDYAGLVSDGGGNLGEYFSEAGGLSRNFFAATEDFFKSIFANNRELQPEDSPPEAQPSDAAGFDYGYLAASSDKPPPGNNIIAV